MRLLFLTPQRPYPPHQGTSIRNFHIIEQLASRHQIFLLSFLEPDQPFDAGPLATLCEQLETIPMPQRSLRTRLWQLVTTLRPDMAWRLWSLDFAIRLQDWLQAYAFDVVQIEGIEMAPYLPTIQTYAPQAKIVYDNHNAEWLLQHRNYLADRRNPRRWVAAAYSLVQTQRLKQYERWICQQSQAVIAVSQADREAIQQLDPTLIITVIPNGVDVAACLSHRDRPHPNLSSIQADFANTLWAANPLGSTAQRWSTAAVGKTKAENLSVGQDFDLVFTGKMDYRPNIDAMLWFCDNVLPEILGQRPETRLAIVGQKPHPRLDRLRQQAAITITGFVDSVSPYIADAKVYIAPFRVGGGTRLKLLQAMAMSKAIVSTQVGAEGFDLISGQNIILVDDPQQMAQEILLLLHDPARRLALGQQAQQIVAKYYDWQTLIPQMEALYDES